MYKGISGLLKKNGRVDGRADQLLDDRWNNGRHIERWMDGSVDG